MPVALDDFRGALGSFLGSFCKSVKSHHKKNVLVFVKIGQNDYSILH
jgi:hypothetical protein